MGRSHRAIARLRPMEIPMHTFTFRFRSAEGHDDWQVVDATNAHAAKASLLQRFPGASEVELEEIEDDQGFLVASFSPAHA